MYACDVCGGEARAASLAGSSIASDPLPHD